MYRVPLGSMISLCEGWKAKKGMSQNTFLTTWCSHCAGAVHIRIVLLGSWNLLQAQIPALSTPARSHGVARRRGVHRCATRAVRGKATVGCQHCIWCSHVADVGCTRRQQRKGPLWLCGEYVAACSGVGSGHRAHNCGADQQIDWPTAQLGGDRGRGGRIHSPGIGVLQTNNATRSRQILARSSSSKHGAA